MAAWEFTLGLFSALDRKLTSWLIAYTMAQPPYRYSDKKVRAVATAYLIGFIMFFGGAYFGLEGPPWGEWYLAAYIAVGLVCFFVVRRTR